MTGDSVESEGYWGVASTSQGASVTQTEMLALRKKTGG